MSAQLGMQDKFAALSTREKSLVLIAGVAVIIMVAFTFLIEPAFKKLEGLNRDIGSAQAMQSSLQAQQQAFEDALAKDPDLELRGQLAALKKRHQALEVKFAQQLEGLVLPSQMPTLIEQVFAQAKGLTLVEMASVAPVNVFADDPQMKDIALYQHGLRLQFEGSYFAVRDFLAALEQRNSQVYWRAMSYRVDEYPKAMVTLEVYTLSSEKAFIGVK